MKDTVRSRPHWEVVIRPADFKQRRIEQLSSLWTAVAASVVMLRGWDYPHVDDKNTGPGNDFVESWVDFMGHVEYWRMYQSGLFVHRFLFDEDHEPGELARQRMDRLVQGCFEPGGYLDFVNCLYTTTEVAEFAARLATRLGFGPGCVVEISLVNVADRVLMSADRNRPWTSLYRATAPRLDFRWEGSVVTLVGESARLAREAAVFFFERFGWRDPPLALLADEQAALLKHSVRVPA
ncbi:MAG: hypothetical protein IT303_00075 [Dehalococcoidia bacterium]|nr:hypothetical protein [Dehalococcoidia bacterium]